MHNYTTYEVHVRYVELPQHEHENHHHDKRARQVMFWNQKKKEKAATGNEKKRFDHLLSVAEKLPVMTLPDLIRAIVRQYRVISAGGSRGRNRCPTKYDP
ncbi:hypothetical protein [Klebsiella pneumoniae]|uniref:hypothetical protein n=1 Tax=Klebsiella pneumoniae TaxID=573 RepID=UPI001D01FFAD|nr:hypothetical protein [Klebsiella pneumoniae]